MFSMPMNFWSIGAAAVASWIFGAAYYGLLGRRWMAALGRPDAAIKARDQKKAVPIGAMIVSLIAELVMAAVLYGLIVHIVGQPAVRTALVAAGLSWLGFVVTVLATNYAYQRAKPSLTLIDSGHWLGALLIQGLVIGAIG